MYDLLILNGRIVNEHQQFEGDILIHAGHIQQIGPDLQHLAAKTTLDVGNQLIIPGMIDDQVHFREPGLTHKADIATESSAAVAGGITSFMDMPNTKPPTLSAEALEQKCQLAAAHSRANYSFYLGASNDNLAAIQQLDPRKACGIKVFMGASTGNLLVDDVAILRQIFATAPCLIATHCEDTPLILDNERRFQQQYGLDIPMSAHPLIRSEEACFRSSSLAIELAKTYQARLHVLHITTARELSQFSALPLAQKRITAEACVHHLYFDDSDYAEKGTLIKCNPAIKRPEDRQALLQALNSGLIDVIGTDHAPHTLAEKNNPYLQAPAGLPLVQYALPSLFEHYHNGVLSLETLVAKTSHAVATCFNIQQRGFIREGYWADLAILALNAPYTVQRQDGLSKCGWSPFEGRTLRTRVMTTVVSGQVAYTDGQVNAAGRGQRLEFSR